MNRNNYFSRIGTGMLFASLLISIIFISSCKEEEDKCPTQYLGKYNMLSNARGSIPFTSDVDLRYRNSQGVITRFDFNTDATGYVSSAVLIEKPCSEDPDAIQKYTAEIDFYSYSIAESVPLTELNFIWQVSVQLEIKDDSVYKYDVFGIGVFRDGLENEISSELAVLVNQRSLPDEDTVQFPVALPEIVLRGKTFKNVYTNPDSTVYYNFSQGMVAFRDNSDELWILDGVE